MNGADSRRRSCLRCGELFSWGADTCPHCGAYQAVPPQLNVWGLSFMQNRLRRFVLDGEIAEPIAARLIGLLRQEQLAALGKARPVESTAPRPPASTELATMDQVREITVTPAEAVSSAPARSPVLASAPATPGALATSLAGPNVLLYLGAFLIVVSGLILVGITPEDLSAQLKVLLGIGGTLGFLAAGLLLHPSETVRPAARTFLLLGAILVPLDVWSVGTVALDVSHPARQQLLLTGSLLSAALYAVLAQRGYGVHFVYLMAIALVGAAEGIAQTFALDAAWRALPHFGLAAALMAAARSRRTALAPLSGAPEGLIASVEAYAGTLVAWLVIVRILGEQVMDVPNLVAAMVFAVIARTRVASERAEFWSWTACAAGALGAYGLVPRQAPALARVAALLAIAVMLWIAPLRLRPARWALAPGRALGWLAVAAALAVGFGSGPDARALALAGATTQLAFIAWTTERHDAQPGPRVHPVLIGALLGTYALWVSVLQVAALLPADPLRAPSALAWATFAAGAAAWSAAVMLVRNGDPWATDLRAAAHALAAMCVVLMLSIGTPRPPRPDGFAVGASLGALAAGLALVYAAGLGTRRVPESAGLVIAFGAAAVLGGIETLMGGASPWATVAAAILGTVALASVAFARERATSVRAGAVGALMVALTAQLINVRVAPELTFALLVLLGGLVVGHLVPLVEREVQWTLPAGAAVFAFILARLATNALGIDPQLATLPFAAILAAPGAAFAARGRRSPEAERLLGTAVIALAMATALSLGRYGPAWSPAVAAVVIGSLALLSLRRRDAAMAGAPVALAVLAAETTIRHSGVRDILYQGVLYGLVVLAGARLLASRDLLGDTPVTRAIYATAVALLTLPAMVRAAQPGGWVAVAYLAVGAAALITAAVRLRQPAIGIAGSVLGLMSLVTGIYQTHVAETLAYTTAVGAYLIGLGLYLGGARSLATAAIRDLLALIRWTGALLLLIPAVVRSWEGAQYGVVFFVLFGLVLGGGLLLRQRSMLGSAAAALGLESVWVVTTVARLLPFWMLFGLAGLMLLGAGTVLVFRRDLLERAQERFRAQWEIAE